ncbi:OTU-domain-containing protein [Rostrohypoxylon terebratum]|nr:OTU-domain-containing protein [Rostrohypoxylon terebratum]
MKVRYRAPSGAGNLELPDDATVKQLLEALQSATGLANFTIKYGWPPKTLDTDESGASLRSLGLDREALTIATLETAPAVAQEEPQAIASDPASSELEPEPEPKGKGKGKGVRDQQIAVFMPETNSTLVLRVMPDDNSCLFNAVGGALHGYGTNPDQTFDAKTLRRIVVEHILANPEKYSAVILGKNPETYCNTMLDPETWGGDIELSVLSEVFRIEISVVDVKTGTLYRIGEGNGYEMRCVVVYSNVHYDRVVEIFVEGQASIEFDVARWVVDESDHIIKHAQEMCESLRKEHHYYTDTSDFVVTCNECGWLGQGEKSVIEHALQTGHKDVSEIKDNS